MYFSEHEKEMMEPFLALLRTKKLVNCEWKYGTHLVVRYLTEYDSLNDYDEDDPLYEDYYAAAVFIHQIISFDERDGFLFSDLEACFNDTEHRFYELSYHSIPQNYNVL